MNKAILMGRLTADPEIRYTQDHKAVGSYTIACDRWGDKAADFIRCTVWEKRAEFAEKYLRKGSKVLVVGRIQTGSYTDRNGKKISTFEIVVDEQEFAESKAAETKQEPPKDDFLIAPDAIDDELPFE